MKRSNSQKKDHILRIQTVKGFSAQTNPRGSLALLHLAFGILCTQALTSFSISRLHTGVILGYGLLALLVLTLPKLQLTEPWFMASLTLGDAAVFVGMLQEHPTGATWAASALMILLAMASHASSAFQILTLNCLVLGGYGFSLYDQGRMHGEALSAVTAFLCLMYVFVIKSRITQAEVQRIVATEEQARSVSMSDALTGLPNRAQFLEKVARSIQYRRHTRGFEFAVLFIDLDGFKPINDRLGHKAGDAVLRETAKRLHACLRKGDTVGRYGGDEFTLLINNVSGPPDAVRVAERVLNKLKEPIFVGEDVHVGASIGIALSTNLHEIPEDLIRDADQAMYRAKGQGKNRHVISDQAQDLPKAEIKERWKRIAGAANRWTAGL
jgi:diguanylate cyclase (GGDEF)-like protein